MRYKRKSIEVEAVKWTGYNYQEMFDFLGWDIWNKKEMTAEGEHFYLKSGGMLTLKDGEIAVKIGNYVVRKDNNILAFNGDIFEKDFEPNTTSIPSLFVKDITPNPYIDKYPYTEVKSKEKTPYSVKCSCNPLNGGSGVCGCTMANNLVDA